MAKSNAGKKSITREEYVTNKVLTVFSICLLGVLVLMILQRLLSYGSTFMLGMVVQKVLLVTGLIGAAWGISLLVRERNGKRRAENRIICGRHVLIVSIAFVIIMALVGHFGMMVVKALYVILPALAVYYLVYHSYAPEFFIIALDCGAALCLIWIVRRALVSSNYGFMAYAATGAMAAIAILQLVCTAQVRGKKGEFQLAGRKFSFQFSKNAYTMLFVTPLVMTAAVAAAMIPAAGLACMGVAAGYLFITAVYYTVKLM